MLKNSLVTPLHAHKCITLFVSIDIIRRKYLTILLCKMLQQVMTGLECGHRFCVQCWGEYLTTKIMEEGVGQTIACAAHGCDILVDDATVMRLVREPKVKLKYQHLITNSFVEVIFHFFFF
jgi:hypothetical protein